MALANNTRFQLAQRLTQNLKSLNPDCTIAQSTDGIDPALAISDTSGVIAVAVIRQKTFIGLNIVAEISSSAGEGTPEHDLFLAMLPTTSPSRASKLSKAASLLGTASLKIVEDATPLAAHCVDANVTAEIPNSAEFGSVGI